MSHEDGLPPCQDNLVPAVAPSEASVCGGSEVVGSNPAGEMDVFLLWILCVVM